MCISATLTSWHWTWGQETGGLKTALFVVFLYGNWNGGWGDDLAVKSLGCSCRFRFHSQHPHSSSPLSAIAVPGAQMPSSDFYGDQAHTWYKYIHVGKILTGLKINLYKTPGLLSFLGTSFSLVPGTSGRSVTLPPGFPQHADPFLIASPQFICVCIYFYFLSLSQIPKLTVLEARTMSVPKYSALHIVSANRY